MKQFRFRPPLTGVIAGFGSLFGHKGVKDNGEKFVIDTDKDGNDRMQEEIQANYERIRQEVRQIVEDEITRIKNDPELCHLIKEEEE